MKRRSKIGLAVALVKQESNHFLLLLHKKEEQHHNAITIKLRLTQNAKYAETEMYTTTLTYRQSTAYLR